MVMVTGFMKDKIGLVDVDGKRFPNLALMKIARWHRTQGDTVEWAMPIFSEFYDKVYKSKVFSFTKDDMTSYPCEVVKGGTGYDIHSMLPENIDKLQPDYSIYPQIDKRTAYGFLTRGCPNKCKWCIVPEKEGAIRPYMDIEEIAIEGRTNIILMDNNILASDYGLQQIEKIVKLNLRVDFNQALDARLVTSEIAKLLSKVRWINCIRLGCDTHKQIGECERSMRMIDAHRNIPASYLMYTMIDSNMQEAYERLSHFRHHPRVRIVAQPFRDYNNPHQLIPQWQRDMARWAMRREFYTSFDFKDFEPRKGFKCIEYFKNKNYGQQN